MHRWELARTVLGHFRCHLFGTWSSLWMHVQQTEAGCSGPHLRTQVICAWAAEEGHGTSELFFPILTSQERLHTSD